MTELEIQDQSADEWMRQLYQQLRAMARNSRLRIGGGETLQTTALINESYLHLSGSRRYGSRGEFLRVAATVMRNVLIDRVREQLAAKRGGGVAPLPLEAAEHFVVEQDEAVLAVHEGLEALARFDAQLAEVVQCRYFAGYDENETAEALGLSRRTVQRDWALARAWLRRELSARPSATG